MASLEGCKGLLERLVSQRSWLLATTSGAVALAAFTSWCVKDYREFLALGPGGPPYNVGGWAVITFIVRPFTLSRSDVTSVADYPTEGSSPEIRTLPARQGERALVGGIGPHRQLSQHAPEHMKTYIENLFTNAARQHPSLLETKLSLYERRHDALFIASNLLESHDSNLPETAITSRGEVGHAHPDLSVHLYVSPADARVLIEKCWAERHRLAVPDDGWLKIKKLSAVGSTYLMIYGPRDEEEMEILRLILENSIRYMTGRDNVKSLSWREVVGV